MEEELISILFNNFNQELVAYIIGSGFVIFLLYFSGSRKWKDFSDFDKLSFSILTGIIVYYLIAIPIYVIGTTLSRFFNHTYEIFQYTNEQIITTYQIIFFVLVIRLFMWKYESETPLFDNTDFHKSLYSDIIMGLFVLGIFHFLLIIALSFSDYSEYTTMFIAPIFIAIMFTLIFLLIYSCLHREVRYTEPFSENKLLRFLNKNRKKTVLTFIILIFISVIAGNLLFDATIIEKAEYYNEIHIYGINMLDQNDIGASTTMIKQLEIKMPVLIPWTKVSFDHKIRSAQNSDVQNIKYSIKNDDDTYYFFVNKSSPIVNVSVQYQDSFRFAQDELIKIISEEYDDSNGHINLYYTNDFGSDIIIDFIKVPINNSYYLKEEDFMTSKFVKGTKSDFGKYNVNEGILTFNGVGLENNSSGYVNLTLTKKE